MRSVFVHGGVAGTPKALVELDAAITAGMSAGGAVDAVIAAIIVLEEHPDLNAGYGATLTRDGTIELDAGIAGRGGSGAVAGVRVRHPIVAARRVMEDTPHVLIVGDGGGFLADLEDIGDTTKEQHETWAAAKAAGALDPANYGDPEYVDTVGCVALDDDGIIAVGASTGGVLGKLPGRIGDSPIFGAGFYASSAVGVIGTGLGELFIESVASFRAGALIEDGVPPQTACEMVLAFIGQRDPIAAAGLMAITPNGDFGSAFRGGSWSVCGPDGSITPVQVD